MKPGRILLIAPRWGHVYGKYNFLSRRFNFHPPLGLCYIASSIRNAGHVVRIIDAEAENKSLEDILNEVKTEKYDYVGLTSTTPIYDNAIEIAKTIKENFKVTVLLGGPHPTIVREGALHSSGCFDYLICGEGERTLISFFELHGSVENVLKIPGLVFRYNGEPIDTGPAEKVADLDLIPFPDRSHLNASNYLWSVPRKGLISTTSIIYSRGCPFECLFCSQDIMFSRKVRFRSVDNVIAEIEEIVGATPYRHFVFLDDTLTWNRERTIALFQSIADRRFNITFEGETRANLLDAELVKLLKGSGLVRMNIGIESGDPEILKILKTGIRLEDVENAFRLLKEHGIETRGSVMIGNPYETKERAMKTIKFVTGLKTLDQPYINIAMPYPGTRLREMALKSEGGLRLDDFCRLC